MNLRKFVTIIFSKKQEKGGIVGYISMDSGFKSLQAHFNIHLYH